MDAGSRTVVALLSDQVRSTTWASAAANRTVLDDSVANGDLVRRVFVGPSRSARFASAQGGLPFATAPAGSNTPTSPAGGQLGDVDTGPQTAECFRRRE